jgi:hypothetical protein
MKKYFNKNEKKLSDAKFWRRWHVCLHRIYDQTIQKGISVPFHKAAGQR